MVRTVHINIFHNLDFEISDSENDFGTKTENSVVWKYGKVSLWTQKLTFEVVSRTEITLKYILDYS